ncbi:cholecystokinin receptor-like [Babylonia areolata]|uniref:cholecystokinin receptor-like n=1 Tax=Babylonia areolata TaxID=304850 RepID=UPI003FCFCA87
MNPLTLATTTTTTTTPTFFQKDLLQDYSTTTTATTTTTTMSATLTTFTPLTTHHHAQTYTLTYPDEGGDPATPFVATAAAPAETGGLNSSSFSDYVYEYDYDVSVSTLPLNDVVVNGVGYGLVLVLGLVGNILVVVSVARYRRMHNVTNIFLLSLASADLLLVCICVPVKFTGFITFTWRLGEVMCKGVHYLQNVSIICSVLNLTGLSLERYYAILHPMRARYTCTVKLARRTVLVIWALSLIMAVPILVGQEHIMVGERKKGYWCMEQWAGPELHQLYQLYMLLVVYLLPLTFMTANYVSICRRLWQVRYQRASIRAEHSHMVRPEPSQQSLMPFLSPTTTGSAAGDACASRELRQMVRQLQKGARCKRSPLSEDATRKQVVKMLVAVVVLFAVCWGPILINNVLVAFGVLEQLHHGWLKPMRQVFWLMAYLNSSLNPIVYGFMSKNFRDSFRNTVWRCMLRRPPYKDSGAHIYWRCSFQPMPSALSSARSPSIFSDSEGRHLSVPSVSVHRFSAPSIHQPPGHHVALPPAGTCTLDNTATATATATAAPFSDLAHHHHHNPQLVVDITFSKAFTVTVESGMSTTILPTVLEENNCAKHLKARGNKEAQDIVTLLRNCAHSLMYVNLSFALFTNVKTSVDALVGKLQTAQVCVPAMSAGRTCT